MSFSVTLQGLEQPTASDVDVVEFLAPLATVDASWEPDVRIPPTVDNLRYDIRVVVPCLRVVCEHAETVGEVQEAGMIDHV